MNGKMVTTCQEEAMAYFKVKYYLSICIDKWWKAIKNSGYKQSKQFAWNLKLSEKATAKEGRPCCVQKDVFKMECSTAAVLYETLF